MEWFEEWFDSPYYHLLYRDRSDCEAAQFVDLIVRHFQLNENHKLLDVACGKGRHAKAFAAYGIDVTGIDISTASIISATEFEHEKLHFYVHDMRHLLRTNYYDIVCNLFTSFGYFKTANDHTLAVRSMFQAVKKGGKVLIDFVNRNSAIQSIASRSKEEKMVNEVRFSIQRSYTLHRLVKKITVKDGLHEFHFEESLKSFTFDEMTSLFLSEGFIYNECFGNYDLDEYDENGSPRMILVFTK